MDGPITFRRVRYVCSKTGRSVFPVDEALDLPSGDVTASLARRALRLATFIGFAELQEELREQHDVRVTDSTLDTLMRKAGGVAHREQQVRVDKLEAASPGRSREKLVSATRPAPRRMYISCDGITYRTRLRQADSRHKDRKCLVYQEMKVGRVFWQQQDGAWQKQVVVGRDGPERFGLSLWELAVQCGLLDCPEVIFISDGGVWCQSVAETYFKEARRILDWYHLSEHIWTAARMLYPQNEKLMGGWAGGSVYHLHEGGGIGLLHHLERCRAVRPVQDAPAIEALLNYLRPRLAITNYVEYRRRGYVIGSGMMESTCKQVVARRLKGSGMQWSEHGALAMTSLIAHRLNGTWSQFWSRRPLQLAA